MPKYQRTKWGFMQTFLVLINSMKITKAGKRHRYKENSSDPINPKQCRNVNSDWEAYKRSDLYQS